MIGDGRTETTLPGPRSWPRGAAALAAVALLAALVLASLWLGTRGLGPGRTLEVLLHPDGSAESAIVHRLRLPRTLLGLLVGAALGVSGAVMQGLTRNPLADPGLLGVTMGASSAVVLGTAFLGVAAGTGQLLLAFAGAAAAAVAVQLLGGPAGPAGPSPDRLVLAGTAVTAALYAVNSAVLLLHPDAFGSFRFWNVGSLSGRDTATVAALAPVVLAGVLLSAALARSLDVLALGDDASAALGTSPVRTRLLGALAVTVLCGGATAAAGPVGFVGLAVPHAARLLVGSDQRWVLGLSLVLAPALLLAADVLGRLVLAPGEVQVGVVTALVGAPVFVALCRRRSLVHL